MPAMQIRGANNLQNFPVLTAATYTATDILVSGTLNSMFSATITVDFYGSVIVDPSGNGEGETYLGSTTVVTDGSGNATFTNVALPLTRSSGTSISATATDATGNTSEFSASITASPFSSSQSLWTSTDSDIGAPGADGLPSGWRQGEVLEFGGPDLTFGQATDGDFPVLSILMCSQRIPLIFPHCTTLPRI